MSYGGSAALQAAVYGQLIGDAELVGAGGRGDLRRAAGGRSCRRFT